MQKTKIVAFTVLSLVFTLFLIQPSSSQTSFNWKWSPQVAFKLPAYNTVIAFNNYVYMNSFAWDSLNASTITFYNINLQGEPETASHFAISVQNANITITRLLHDKKFTADLQGLTGTVAYLRITNSLYPKMPGTVAIAGIPITMPHPTKTDFDNYNGNCWYYDTTTNTIHIKAILHSPTNIYIDWNPAPAPAPTPPTQPTPTQPTPQPTITPPTLPPWLILTIILAAAIAIYTLKKR